MCLIKAYQGQYFKLPVIGNFAEKFSAEIRSYYLIPTLSIDRIDISQVVVQREDAIDFFRRQL